MADSKLTYDEYVALTLQKIPADQQEQWLQENNIESAPFLAEGWVIIPKDKNLPGYRNQDDFPDYEHAREIE